MTEKTPPSSGEPSYKITAEQLDRYVDVANVSYDDAYKHFDVKPEEVDFAGDYLDDSAPKDLLKSTEDGPSLSLIGRAKVLDDIMRQFNQENKAGGADFSRDYNGMERRYGNNIDEVIGNMHYKASRMGNRAIVALDVLSNGDSGIPMPAGIDYSGSIESDLRRNFGPGVAYARDRSKMLTRVYKSARAKRPK